jgi:hypothetical protein
MDRRTLMISLAALGGCGPIQRGRLEALTDPDLEVRLNVMMTAYASEHAGLNWSLTTADAVGLYNRAEAPGARVIVTRETKLTDNLQRTRRAALENRWTLGFPDAPIAVVVTKGAGEHVAKAFAEWLAAPNHRQSFEAGLPGSPIPLSPDIVEVPAPQKN